MLLRVLIGFPILVGAVVVGAGLARERASAPGRPWREAAGGVHRTTGIVALALLAVLAITALRLVL